MVIKQVLQDLKGDIKFIYDLCRGKAQTKKISKEELKTIKPKELFKEYYIWFILLILAFLVGYNISAKVHQQKCNDFIYEQYIKNTEYDPFNQYASRYALLYDTHNDNATHKILLNTTTQTI